MSNTSNLSLPYLAVGQAQKHVTVNETLRTLDAIIQLSVVSATTTAEPSTPTDGAVYIVPSGKSGTHWSAFANWSLGYYRDGAWTQISPREGWLAFVRDTDQLLYYTGSAWSLFPAARLITVSATDKIVGRISSGAGAAEEVAFTDQAQALCDDTSFSAMRTTLGAAGLSDANSFSQPQTLDAAGGDDVIHFRASGSDRFKFGWISSAWRLLAYNNSGAFMGTAQIVDGPSMDSSFGARVLPINDNTQKLGDASNRWSTVYAGTGAINTSDAREKTGLRPLNLAERRAIRRVLSSVGVFQWLSSIALKGADPAQGGARMHAGVTAQAVADAFAAEGLDAAHYALYCADAITAFDEIEPGLPAAEARPVIDPATGEQLVRLGVRYDQLMAMALAALFEG